MVFTHGKAVWNKRIVPFSSHNRSLELYRHRYIHNLQLIIIDLKNTDKPAESGLLLHAS